MSDPTTTPNTGPPKPFVPDPSKGVDGEDFKLAKPGQRDYVAGQPVDEKELADTVKAAKARLDAAHQKPGVISSEGVEKAWEQQMGPALETREPEVPQQTSRPAQTQTPAPHAQSSPPTSSSSSSSAKPAPRR